MNVYHSRTGPFIEQPFYKPEEIENICSDELKKVGLYPAEPEPIRIDRFIEKRFGVCPTYDDLPAGILGFTRFGPAGVEEIVVARALADEGSKVSERRISTTLAHEAGHGLLHAHLFALGVEKARSLFGDGIDIAAPRILCRENSVEGIAAWNRRRYDGRWWEVQANKVIGALLLPKLLIVKCLTPLLVPRGSFGLTSLDDTHRDRAIAVLAEIFDVSRVVATIRLEALYPAGTGAQLTL